MRFSSLLVLVLALPLSSVACKKKNDDAKTTSSQDDDGKKKKANKAESDDDEASAKKKKKGSTACKAPESPITADFTFPEGCELELDHELVVAQGVTLTLEPGVKLSFPPGSRLDVDGKLVAKGTDDAPIVLTSKNSSPAAGDWEGIIFREKTSAGTVLDHVVVEYAGAASYGHGAITLSYVSPGRVSITSSKIRHNGTAGLHVDTDTTTFAKFEGNTFEDNGKTSLRIPASTLGSVGKNNKLGEPVKIGGDVKKTQTWPKLDVPIHVVEHVRIGGEEEAVVLTLADDTVLKFSPEKHLWIGADKGGALVSKGATFTSVNASPEEGDWEGLIIDEKANQTKITDCVIEYAGFASYGKGGVTFHGKTAKEVKNVKIEGCTFKHVKHGAFWSQDQDCGAFADANKAVSVPICAKE